MCWQYSMYCASILYCYSKSTAVDIYSYSCIRTYTFGTANRAGGIECTLLRTRSTSEGDVCLLTNDIVVRQTQGMLCYDVQQVRVTCFVLRYVLSDSKETHKARCVMFCSVKKRQTFTEHNIQLGLRDFCRTNAPTGRAVSYTHPPSPRD